MLYSRQRKRLCCALYVSQAAPYRHSENKDELIAAIAPEAVQAFSRSLDEAAGKYPGDPAKRLKETGRLHPFFLCKSGISAPAFSSGILGRMSAAAGGDCRSICSGESRFERGNPFATFYSAAKAFAAASPDKSMGQDELLLYCRRPVHGISALLAGKEEFPYPGNVPEAAERIVRSGKFQG